MRENKNLILVIFLAIFIMASFVSAGTPEILNCAENTEFFSGDLKNAEFLVKNKGTQGGQFTGVVQGSGLAAQSLFLDAGDTATFSIQISGTNTEGGTQNNVCEFTVTDLNSQSSDTCNFNCNVKFQPNLVCSPDSVRCISGDILRTCSSDGSTFTDAQCSNNQKCSVADDGTGSCVIDENQSQNNFSINSALIIALGIIAGLVILGLLIRKRKK